MFCPNCGEENAFDDAKRERISKCIRCEKSLPQYSVKVNDIVKDAVLHKYDCSQVRRRAGSPGKDDQVHWVDFDRRDDAEKWINLWVNKGYKGKNCKKC